MKNAGRYFNSAKIIMDGMDNETLLYDSVGGCVVAHLIAGNNGYKFHPVTKGIQVTEMIWCKQGKVVAGSMKDWGQLLEVECWRDRVKLCAALGRKRFKWANDCLVATGYTKKELKEITELFNACYNGFHQSQNIKTGVSVVLTKLKLIHAVTKRDRVVYGYYFGREWEFLNGKTNDSYPSIKRMVEDIHFDYRSCIIEKQTQVKYTVGYTVGSTLLPSN